MAQVKGENTLKQGAETERGNQVNESTLLELVEHLRGKPGKSKLVSECEAWDDLRLAGSSLGAGATAPALIDFLGAANSLKVKAFAGTGGTKDQLYFELQMPHAWKEGTDIDCHIHWTPATANTGNVVWQLEYSWVNIGDTFPTAVTISGTGAALGAWKHTLTSIGEINAKGKTFSSMLVGRLFRDFDHASDTYEYNAALLEIDFHYRVNSLGSYEEYKSYKQ